jgi:hypothetical protein
LKPGASLGISGADEEKTPILSFMRVGNGRTLAFGGELDGKFTGPFGAWKEAGDIFLSCMRWLNSSQNENDDFFIKSRREGNEALITIELDPDRKSDPFSSEPRIMMLSEGEKQISKKYFKMRWNDADSLSSVLPIPEEGTSYYYISAPDAGGQPDKLLRAAVYRLPYPQEFRPEKDFSRGRKTLERLARMSGGRERISMDGIFDELSSSETVFPLSHIIALASMIFLICEIAFRRFLPSVGLRDEILLEKLRSAASLLRLRAMPVKTERSPKKDIEDGLKDEAKDHPETNELFPSDAETAIDKAKKRIKKRMKNT